MEAEKALRGIIDGLPEGHPDIVFLSPYLREIETYAQLSYLDFERFPKTEAEVKEELARQADRYIEFGLHGHTEVKMEKGKFKDSLVALWRVQPERFAGRFDIPVAVLGQVPAKDVYEAEGVDYLLEGLDVRDWPDDPQEYKTPQGLYLAWMDTGVGKLNREVEDVRLSLERDARGATELDGSGLYVAHPIILEHHFIDLPGTFVGRNIVPSLGLFRDGPRVAYVWVAVGPGFGAALCGRD